MRALKVAVIDYESGNLRSVSKALERAGVQPEVTGDPKVISGADMAVLPGVGAGDAAMAALRRRELVEPLREFVASGKPFLGICLVYSSLWKAPKKVTPVSRHNTGYDQKATRGAAQGLKLPHMAGTTLASRWLTCV